MSISGKTFGSWVVIKDVGNSKWLCRCKCGKYKEVKKYSLIHGKSKSCGCSYKYTINIGDVYNNLLVESSYLDKERQRTVYICKCLLCGNTKQVLGKDLARGKVKSCGCLVRSINGQSKTRLYSIWTAMTNRCQNKMHKAYNRYGGRGITCIWQTFEEFKHDMYDSYLAHVKEFGEKNTTIDRIDVNGNYCKENCRWATIKEQANNKTNNIVLNFKGKCLTMAQWAEELGIKYSTIKRRKYIFGYTEAKDLLAQPHKISKEVIDN